MGVFARQHHTHPPTGPTATSQVNWVSNSKDDRSGLRLCLWPTRAGRLHCRCHGVGRPCGQAGKLGVNKGGDGVKQCHSKAKDVKLWALEARRSLVLDLLDCWVEKCERSATVEALLTALSHPNFKDMKIRVERMINMS